jgi:hypothetical protein
MTNLLQGRVCTFPENTEFGFKKFVISTGMFVVSEGHRV